MTRVSHQIVAFSLRAAIDKFALGAAEDHDLYPDESVCFKRHGESIAIRGYQSIMLPLLELTRNGETRQLRKLTRRKYGHIINDMAVTTIKSTYSLDIQSMRKLEELAQRWNVSKTEVLRRAIRMAAMQGDPGNRTPFNALDRLQSSLREREVDVSQWARDLKAERRAAARNLPSKFQ